MDHPESDEFDQVVGDWLPEFDPELEFYTCVYELVEYSGQFAETGTALYDAKAIELQGKIYENAPVKFGEFALVKGNGRVISEAHYTDLSAGDIVDFPALGSIMRLRGFTIVEDVRRGGQRVPCFLAARNADQKEFLLPFGEATIEKLKLDGDPDMGLLEKYLPVRYFGQLLEIAKIAVTDRSAALQLLSRAECPHLNEVLRVEENKLLCRAFRIDGWRQALLSTTGEIINLGSDAAPCHKQVPDISADEMPFRPDMFSFIAKTGDTRRTFYLRGTYRTADGEFLNLLVNCANETRLTYIDEMRGHSDA